MELHQGAGLSLVLSSAGTGADALKLEASAGSLVASAVEPSSVKLGADAETDKSVAKGVEGAPPSLRELEVEEACGSPPRLLARALASVLGVSVRA